MDKLKQALMKKLRDAGSTYEGQANDLGQRHGRGRCTYIDGSFYDGEWADGKRNGYGEYTIRNGPTYKGGWQNDVKHGQGELYMPDGRIIMAEWQNDKMHGKGVYTESDGKRVYAIYYNDIEIKMSDQNPNNYDKFHNNLFWVLATLGFLWAKYAFRNNWILIGFFICYCVQFGEIYGTKTYKYLNNILSPSDVK